MRPPPPSTLRHLLLQPATHAQRSRQRQAHSFSQTALERPRLYFSRSGLQGRDSRLVSHISRGSSGLCAFALVLLACAAAASAWHGPATQRNTERDQLSRSTCRNWMSTGISSDRMCVRRSRRACAAPTAVRCTEGQLALPEEALRHLIARAGM